ncbi:MFS transporter [Streptomyces millisiae]|uniref:MFS transporter n=1 Tax=Streptomyces millisiae TaxID=3075542 RepID=A0ABU2LIK8_9ACTN|nr:MFS transporter [Streptomyces sp. DSM 44918]MDT0317356.1 MFS transporter [Streptomyces sp. DSM 44918]
MPRPGESTTRRRSVALASILLATFVGHLDSSIVLLALPAIREELGASYGQTQFVVAGYTAAYAAGLVTGGRLGDLHGRKRVFQLGVAAFTLLSAACALAPDATALLTARTLQGLSAALMLPQVLAIVQATFAGSERARAIGAYGATMGLAWIAGPLGGGALLAWDPGGLGWRALFLVNLPVGPLILLAARRTVVESRGPRQRLDLAGALLLAVALYALLLPPASAEGGHWSGWLALPMAGGLLVLTAFLALERRLQRRGLAPLLPPRLLAERRMARGLGALLAFYGGNMGFFTLIAYHVQNGLERSPLVSGLVFAPLAVGFALASAGSRVPHARFGHRLPVGGALLTAVGLAGVVGIVLRVPEDSQLLWLPLPLALVGLGQGLVASPLITVVLDGTPVADSGAASGVLLTATQVAHASSVTVIGGLFVAVLGAEPGAAGLDFDDYTRATGTACAAALALALLTAVLARRLRPAAPATVGTGRTRDPGPAGPLHPAATGDGAPSAPAPRPSRPTAEEAT